MQNTHMRLVPCPPTNMHESGARVELSTKNISFFSISCFYKFVHIHEHTGGGGGKLAKLFTTIWCIAVAAIVVLQLLSPALGRRSIIWKIVLIIMAWTFYTLTVRRRKFNSAVNCIHKNGSFASAGGHGAHSETLAEGAKKKFDANGIRDIKRNDTRKKKVFQFQKLCPWSERQKKYRGENMVTFFCMHSCRNCHENCATFTRIYRRNWSEWSSIER
jgi:hypothetical protein